MLAAAGSSRNGFGRNRSVSTPEGARGAGGVPIPPSGGSPMRRAGLSAAPSSEHDSELLLLRGCELFCRRAWRVCVAGRVGF